MQKVKNYLNAYKNYAKSERDNLQALKDSNVYNQEYIVEQEKKMNQALETKRMEYLKGINEVIDGKLSSIKKPDTSSADYQATVSNILTKVQLIGRGLTTKLLNEIMVPAIDKQDNGTIEAVRSYITSISEFPGGEPAKRMLLAGLPRIVNQADLLEDARKSITATINDKGFGNGSIKADLTMHFLEESGVFEL